eukprot:TRINITY_DN26566_c0_g2_i6.p2 TRINITY_DN26566_c0_g2~~TRINITY_DN26566_c0_g2_i6.p2  ORF type:complete len:192 (-),score=53.40 TRINITY_DN26566_c0_g2_i6:198-773(-)
MEPLSVMFTSHVTETTRMSSFAAVLSSSATTSSSVTPTSSITIPARAESPPLHTYVMKVRWTANGTNGRSRLQMVEKPMKLESLKSKTLFHTATAMEALKIAKTVKATKVVKDVKVLEDVKALEDPNRSSGTRRRSRPSSENLQDYNNRLKIECGHLLVSGMKALKDMKLMKNAKLLNIFSNNNKRLRLLL